MSKAKTTTKVLRTALGRVQKGWKQGGWTPDRFAAKNNKDGYEDPGFGYCIVGAVTGLSGLGHTYTDVQAEAMALIVESMEELAETRPDIARNLRHPFGLKPHDIIPCVNDGIGFTADDAQLVIKKALIKAETAELMALEGMDDEEIDDLLEDLNSVD